MGLHAELLQRTRSMSAILTLPISNKPSTACSVTHAQWACVLNYCNEPEAQVPSSLYPSAMNPQHRVPSRVLNGAQIGRKEA